MTRYFRESVPKDFWAEAAAYFHYKLYGKSLKRAAHGQAQRGWQVALNNRLQRFYMKRQGFSRPEAQIHFARAFRFILRNMDLQVYDQELIVGNPSSHRVGAPIHPDLGGLLMLPEIEGLSTRTNNPIAADTGQITELKEDIFPYWFNRSVLAHTPVYTENPELFSQMLDGCYFILTQFAGISHVTPDYNKVLRMGFEGIIAEIDQGLDTLQGQAGDPEIEMKRSFYEAARISAEAAVEFGQRWSGYLAEQARVEESTIRKAELEKLSRIFEKVPTKPAESFHEAVQSLFITHVMVHYESFQHGVSFGRVDQYLYPYYCRDLESGRITRAEAVEILGCFIAKAGELLPLFFDRATEYFSGLSSASGLTLGGRKVDGSDGVNELSYLFLHAYDQVRLRQPNFHVRVHDGSPPEFLDFCAQVLKKGGGLPAFFNDSPVVSALVNSGFTEDDAWDYSVVGCVEWGVPGRSFPAAGAVFNNLPMALHLALHEGRFNGKSFGPDTGPLESLTCMEDVAGAFRAQLRHLMETAIEGNNAVETAHAEHRPTPFLSILVDSCP